MKKPVRKVRKTVKSRGGKGHPVKRRSISPQAQKKTPRRYYRGGRQRGAISARTRFIIQTILQILRNDKSPMSARQIFYQCVSNGAVENRKTAYNRVCDLLVLLRRRQIVPYSRIVDRTREMHRVLTWGSIGEGLDFLRNRYRRNPWNNQRVVPMIGMEKDALAGVIEDVVDEYAVPLFVCRGRPSLSLLYDWANEIRRVRSLGKEVRIFYFGDFDPTGVAIPQGIQDSMLNDFGLEVEVEVAGLLPTDKAAFHLLPIALKMGDAMKKGDPLVARFVATYGSEAASELDALPPDELRKRVREKIESCFDVEAWKEIEPVQKEELKTLAEYVETSGYRPPDPATTSEATPTDTGAEDEGTDFATFMASLFNMLDQEEPKPPDPGPTEAKPEEPEKGSEE